MTHYKHVTLADRQKIAELYALGQPVTYIAEQVDFNRVTIYRELKRGYTGKTDHNGRPGYDAELGQARAFSRWGNC